jgi:cytochrome c oxidase cbb3-type subunit 3
MKTAGIVAIALASAAIGVTATGWVMASRPGPSSAGVIATNQGYKGPASIALGDMAGAASRDGAITMPNPYGTDAGAIAQGKQLFMAMNCAGCHGYTGAGGMGPALNDSYWRYGGAPAQIYKTLYEGRPQGMPAWGKSLPADQLWKITAYVSSLGGGVPPEQALAALHGDTQAKSDKTANPNAAEGGSALEGQ